MRIRAADYEIENIFDAALSAVGRGAKGMRIEATAARFFRRQLAARVTAAVEHPDWRARWVDERAYVQAHAEALGRWAARLARDDGRGCIAADDLAAAISKIRGHLPIAGRWCPF